MVVQASSPSQIRRRSRYREERTLVRALLPFPGRDRDSFKQNVRRLRKHFEQFNADVSGLCQWLIRLRPGGPKASATRAFWEFFLEPERFLSETSEADGDRRRLHVFEHTVLGEARADAPLPSLPELAASITVVAQLTPGQAAQNLFTRMRGYQRPHRLVLLKAAAEWIQARYVRVYENWERHRAEWKSEKEKWEGEHPELTEDVRGRFNSIFKAIGVREKRARICSWERLRQNLDNCEFAGEGGRDRHSPLCVKYQGFLRKADPSGRPPWKKHFFENAKEYLKSRKTTHPGAQKWFPKAWKLYLQETGLSESTLRDKYKGDLPHCDKISGDCRFNPHTEKCRLYKEILAKHPADHLALEQEYREWRRLYLVGPGKPVFRYPSARVRSVPKIFGKDYHQIDFRESRVRLRLEDMGPGEFLQFAFKPWPSDYSPQPDQTEIGSVHLHFSGAKPRIGFRFSVKHKPSRFDCTQDELDALRSQKYPRASQDQLFLVEARNRLLAVFRGDPKKELKILAVDLGSVSANAAFFEGMEFREARPLKVVKIEKLYSQPPAAPSQPKPVTGSLKTRTGLSKEHVGRHLDEMAKEASKIGLARQEEGATTLGPNDLRGLARHTAWMMRDWARLNASQIVQVAAEKAVDLIIFESLRGFRVPGYDKLDIEKKRRLAFFAFGRIRRKTIEKAVERGMRVVTVPYLFSSQVCARCGRKQENRGRWLRNKKKNSFHCQHKDCRFTANSDENAARVLGGVFWGQIQLPSS